MTERWNLIVDVALCNHCHNCVLATKDELIGNTFPGYSAPLPLRGPGVIRMERHVRGVAPRLDAAHRPVMCQHCDAGPCLKAGEDGAVRKRADGIVIFDPVKAKGRRDLVDSCPHGAVVWNEEAQLPQTWFFDAHLLDQGDPVPRCVAVCPTNALQAVKLSDEAMLTKVQAERLRTLAPAEHGARVHYRHLERFEAALVAGSVAARIGGRMESVQGAQVTLALAPHGTFSTTTDAFGDFRLDAVPPQPARGLLQVTHPDHGRCERTIELAGSSGADLGELLLVQA